MRKYVSLLLAFVLLIALAVPAAAAEAPKYKTYKLNELPISISLPDNYGCFTMDMEPKDPLFGKFQRDAVKMLDWMVKYNLFLVGAAPDNRSEFRLSISTDEALQKEEDFYEVDEDYLMNTAEAAAESLESRGSSVVDYGSYMSDQLNYFYTVYDYEKTEHVVEFCTVTNVDGDAAMLNLSFVSQKPIDDKTMEMVFDVANNMNITYYPVFYLDDAGKTFMAAPAGCYTVPEMADGKDIKFAARLPEGSFGFATYSSEKASKDVGDLTKISVKDFAKANKLSEDEVDEITYNGQRYLVVMSAENTKINKKDAKIEVCTLFTTYDNMLYMFQYYENASDKDVNAEAFDEFMNSVEYDVEVE